MIAEDLLLLITDHVSGKPHGDAGSIDYGLAAAVLCDLELLGRIHLTRAADARHRRNRVVVDDPSPTGDPLLDQTLGSLASSERTPERTVRVLRKGLRAALYDRLVLAGVLRKEMRRMLGVIPRTRYPALRVTAESDPRAAVIHVFVAGPAPDPRAEALIACLAAVGMVKSVVPEIHPMLSARTIRKRARGYLEANWAAKAARRAYQSDASSGG